MTYYKTFRVENGEIYSAFEGIASPPEKKLHYRVRHIMVDPKPCKDCPGLMILRDKGKSKEFFRACGDGTFVLREVKPLATVKDAEGCGHFTEAYTDSLYVGKKISKERTAKKRSIN